MALPFLAKKKGIPLALDLGSNSIKFTLIKDGEDKPILEKTGIALTPKEAIKDGFVLDQKSVSTVLSQLLAANKIKEKQCLIAISGQQVVVRLIKLPPMSEEEARQAVTYQAERYIPFPVDQVIIDAQVIGEIIEGDAKKTAVLLAAAQKDSVNSVVNAVLDAKLKPMAVDIEPFAALRSALEYSFFTEESNRSSTILFIDIGASSCDISVVSKGILRFARIIPIAGINFTKAVSTTLHLEYEEAEKTKKKLGAAMITDDLTDVDVTLAKQISNVISPILSSLMNEIQRSLAYYESRFRHARVDKIVIGGGSSKLRNLDKYISRDLGLPVELSDPTRNLHIQSGEMTQEFLKEVAPLLGISIGLSLRDLKEENIVQNINFDENFEFGSSRQSGAFGTMAM